MVIASDFMKYLATLLWLIMPLLWMEDMYSSPKPDFEINIPELSTTYPLDEIDNTKAINLALTGWFKLYDTLTISNEIIMIVDFSQPSTNKRLFLYNLKKNEIVYKTYVAHGKNSGETMAQQFSNNPDSYQSSLGFYKTGETYYGKHGLSLKLDGLEKGINHLARRRHIVIHAANYADESYIKKYGRLGRSFGCPAVPKENYRNLIEMVKGGTLLFIYHPDVDYLNNSLILK